MAEKKVSYLWNKSFVKILNLVLLADIFRDVLLKRAEKKLFETVVESEFPKMPLAAKMDRYYMIRAMLHSINRALTRKLISSQVKKVIMRVFIKDILLGDVSRRDAYIEKYGFAPPTFITVSPYQGCNLKCSGCYANSSASKRNTLPFEILEWTIEQCKELWGMRFFVISGGEPLLYESQGKTILDLYTQHDDCYFLMYTNGTLIDDSMARTLGECGNVAPAISVEGFEFETDMRRGQGVYKQIMAAMESLHHYGVPVGFSATATRENAELLVDDKFVDFYFNKMGCVFGYLFHFMPIGRGISVKLQPTPEQRIRMFARQREFIREGYFFVDFWNCGVITNGCISAGRSGGYFYINWNGDVAPCVFAPYSTHNVKNIYYHGDDLNTALQAPFLEDIRKWQTAYSFRPRVSYRVGNQLCQCAIRDHYKMYKKIIQRNQAKPTDEYAALALQDEDYYNGMIEYDQQFKRLADEVWKMEYIEPERQRYEAN